MISIPAGTRVLLAIRPVDFRKGAHTLAAGIANDASLGSAGNATLFRHQFSGPVITAGSYNADTGAASIDAGLADAVAFGRMFITNPDLPERIRRGAAQNARSIGRPPMAVLKSGFYAMSAISIWA